MDQQEHNQPPNLNSMVNSMPQLSYPPNAYDARQMAGNPPGQAPLMAAAQASSQATGGVQLGDQQQRAYQQMQQQQQQQELQQTLQSFWANQRHDVEKINEFKNHSLPLARIKKIMKADEDVRMISAEAPIVFARACEMFILELTLRAWNHTEENKRRTLQKNDIAAAIARTDIFDFLVDIIPREELKDEGMLSVPRNSLPMGGPSSDSLPYYYPVNSQQLAQQQARTPPGMTPNGPVIDPTLYAQPPFPYMAPQLWSDAPQQPQSPSDS
ncbi:OLC1v1000502C1 [Oldenlandia corymbosa var. corymbosa]|uniref:OLC1v1000502C1 n=1 Tax=Oldenlandia corymbosa var. corymbosa TaxID=529605 RepID=A0AAV1D4I6_OLDCO|nr:OLC1v1000502C1 [Oldenlandia corymbosa var. corymbosa]